MQHYLGDVAIGDEDRLHAKARFKGKVMRILTCESVA